MFIPKTTELPFNFVLTLKGGEFNRLDQRTLEQLTIILTIIISAFIFVVITKDLFKNINDP